MLRQTMAEPYEHINGCGQMIWKTTSIHDKTVQNIGIEFINLSYLSLIKTIYGNQ